MVERKNPWEETLDSRVQEEGRRRCQIYPWKVCSVSMKNEKEEEEEEEGKQRGH